MLAEYIDHLGTDLTCVNAARVSFDKESEWAPSETDPFHGGKVSPYNRLQEKDKRLISYLARNGHFTPFTHPQITLRYTVPIFVARQEFKHIVGFTRNEVSRRYVDDEPEFYFPHTWRRRPDASIKQGSGEDLDPDAECYVKADYQKLLDKSLELYNFMRELNVSPEMARMVLPQSMMTSYYITGSLAAYARFYKQRTDSHAQLEIQELAHQVGSIIEPLFPVSWQALVGETDARTQARASNGVMRQEALYV